MRRFILGALLCLCASQAHATVLWRGDFETGNLSQWTELEGLSERITAVTSPVRQGSYAARVELRNGDYSNGGCRNELDYSAVMEGEGSERYYAWSTMFDTSYPSAATWQVFTQFHHTGLNGSPPVEFDVNGESIQLLTGGDKIIWSAPLVRGVWHDFIFHVIWSSNSSTGLLELWYDGNHVLAPVHTATLYAGQQVYLKQGLYRDASIQPTAVLWHDGMTVATTLADVTPATPPPPPPPPATDGGTADAGSGSGSDAGTGSGSDAGSDAGSGSGTGTGSGSADAGSPGLIDGGVVVAPPDTTSTSVGASGCSTVGGSGWMLLALGLGGLLFVRRRR